MFLAQPSGFRQLIGLALVCLRFHIIVIGLLVSGRAHMEASHIKSVIFSSLRELRVQHASSLRYGILVEAICLRVCKQVSSVHAC